MSENKSSPEKSVIKPEFEIEASNLACPLPLLKMKQALNQAKSGQVVFVKATDPASERDFRTYIDMTQHQLVSKKTNGQFLYWITKK